MALIYTYPLKEQPVGDDLLVLSDSADENKTKRITVDSIRGATVSGVSQIVAGTNVTISPSTGTGVVTINASGGGGSGTVTSVGLTMPAAFAVANSPVTTSGTLAVTTTGGSAGQYLDYQGNWSTPANTTDITLTTVGTSGAATWNGTTLNIPQYSSGGTGVTSFTNAFGTYITGTANTSATGAVTMGTVDLNAVDGTAVAATRFLSKDNTWDVPAYTTYNAASSSSLGLMRLFSDTEQSVAANTVTSESNRTYGIQFNADDQAVVNVPWTDTNTTDITLTTSGTTGASTWNGTTLNIPQYSTAAGGSNTQVQFNNSGSFAGSGNLTFVTDTLTLADTLEIKGDGTNPGTLKLFCENVGTPHAVSILGPLHSGATAYEIRLPNVAPSNNQILESNSSGQLSWINTPSGGGGGFPGSVSSVTSNVGLLVNTLYTVTTSSGTPDIEVTLPTAIGNSAKVIGVKYAAQNDINDTVVIKTTSTQTIDGVDRSTNGLPLASLYTYFELVSDGTNWFIK